MFESTRNRPTATAAAASVIEVMGGPVLTGAVARVVGSAIAQGCVDRG